MLSFIASLYLIKNTIFKTHFKTTFIRQFEFLTFGHIMFGFMTEILKQNTQTALKFDPNKTNVNHYLHV